MDCQVHSLIADVAVLADGRVLLVKYRDMEKYDNESGWFLPDGVLHDFEHPEKAARRIAKEQIGLSVSNVHLDHIQSFKGNDGSWHLSFHYAADLDAPPELAPSGDVAAVEWFPLDALPPRSDVAHDGWALQVLKAIKVHERSRALT